MIQLLTPTQSLAPQTTGNLSIALLNSAKLHRTKQAIVFEGTATTYGELEERTQAIAWQLSSLGIKKNDKVGLLFPNNPEFVSSFFAVISLGAVVVPINPLLRSEEIRHILQDSGAKLLIVQSNSLPEAITALPGITSLEHLLVSSSAVVATIDQATLDRLPSHIRAISLTAENHCLGPFAPNEDIDPDKDLALIVYTSGTTGKPKGAMLTHRNVTAVLPGPLLGHCDIGHSDRWLAMLPLCHVYGLGVIVYATIATGGTIAVLEKFDPVTALETIEREKVTLLPAVPSMFQFMVMELERKKYDVSSIRVCFSGAAALTPEVMERTERAFGAPVVEGYALSETACGATINRINARRIGSIGTPLEGIEICIFDESGVPLAPGPENVGEIAVRGNNVMLGYHNQPEATTEVTRDGWFLTGDLGFADEEGYYFIVGRKKEMIIRGGQNIYPREIEDVIMRMEGVREAAVVGVPDTYMGERVKAIVVLATGAALSEEQIKDYCNAHLAPYKVPRLVEIRCDLLPRNSTGKVLKRLLS